MAHMVVYTNERGVNVGMTEWRHKPLLAEQAIALYEILREKHTFVVRLENHSTVKWWNGIESSRVGHWTDNTLNIHHYEDGTEHLKTWVD